MGVPGNVRLSLDLTLRQRKAYLLAGALITFLPPFIWWVSNAILGEDFIRRHAEWYYRFLDPQEMYLYLLVFAGVTELVALFLLEKSRRKPWDWISAFAVIIGSCSILLIMFFLAYSTVITFHGW